MSQEIMIQVDNIGKQYKLGQIGGTTLRDEFKRLRAKLRHKEDPTSKIGAKIYNKGEIFKALDGVSFTVYKGERVGIIGHNGAGKSTLLKLISRITCPSSGTIGLNGRITSMLEVGTGFHKDLTGRENIYINGAILGMTKKEIDSKIDDIIAFSECAQFIDTPVKRYSSGMYVKLAFSVAAHLDSEIMIMDEVLAVGDVAFQEKCLEKMNDVSRKDGRTILYVSHNMNTIRQLCDRVIVLDHGKIIFDGDVEKGIDLYMGNSFNENVKLGQDNIVRLMHNEPDKILFQSAEYREKSSSFNRGKCLPLKLVVKCKENVKNVGFRVEIFPAGGKAICTSFHYGLFSAKPGTLVEFDLDIDVSSLVTGYYKTNYVIFEHGNLSMNDDLDVIKGLEFEINKTDEEGKLSWNSDHWGNVELPESELISIKETII